MTHRAEELPDFLWIDDEEQGPAPVAFAGSSRGGPQPPGEAGLWVFVLGDMTLFALFFVVFLVQLRQHRAGFAASAHGLVLTAGALNTMDLLVGSVFVVLALGAARRGLVRESRRCVDGALATGVIFLGVKAFEWAHAGVHGHSPASDRFFSFYFVLTGIHLLHVLIACALLLWFRRRASDWSGSRRILEGCGVYWHMVDLLWLVIFTLLYVVPVA